VNLGCFGTKKLNNQLEGAYNRYFCSGGERGKIIPGAVFPDPPTESNLSLLSGRYNNVGRKPDIKKRSSKQGREGGREGENKKVPNRGIISVSPRASEYLV
jgi:hypothetical protein